MDSAPPLPTVLIAPVTVALVVPGVTLLVTHLALATTAARIAAAAAAAAVVVPPATRVFSAPAAYLGGAEKAS